MVPAADGGERAGAPAAAVAPAPAEPAIAFVPSSQELLAPSGAKARFAANVAALETLRALEAEGRAAAPEEQAVLARWGGWGHNTLWHVFDENKPEWAAERAQLRELLSDSEYDAARRTTINAHYTDPALVQPIWQALQDLGFEGGRVLEPGCGAGTFIGLAPATAEMVGIELDPITAGIAAHLYPNAQVRNESFAATVFPTGHFDAAVGNVPFADVTLHDPRYNSRRLSMHNHFIAKSLELTRPGGMVAFITSTYTMDSTNPAARRAFAEHADLVAAIRLPNGAHRRAAGTEAGSDLLILRRREDADGPGEPFDETAWVDAPNRASRIPDASERLRVNRYWLDHPDHVLGTMVGDVGAYGAFAMQVEPHPGRDAHEALRDALAAVVADAREQGLVFAPRTAVQQQRAAGFVPAMPDDIDGMLIANPGGGFSVVEDGSRVPLRLPRGVQGPELAALLRLRDQTRALIAAEAANLDDTPQLDTQRQTLAMSWRSYVKAYGPINRYTLRRTGRVDPDTGEEAYARITPPAVRLMLGDPYGALVLALEVFDGDRQTADPAGILINRQIVPRQPVQGVETASDGLAVVLDTVGRVDVDEIARLMGVDRAEAIEQLGDQVFELPGGDRWATRAEYLSGNVREKLDAARAADLNEPGRWAHHIADLEAVLPRDIPAGDISTTVGAIWIADEDYTAFLNHLTDSTYCKVKRLVGSSWDVDGGEWGARATAEFGTSRLPAGKLFKKMLGQEPIEVYDTTEDKKRVLNTFETTAAAEKAAVIQEAFNDWIWQDADRTARLVAEYNRRFNSTVLRDYSYEGSLLTFPGLTKSFTPRDHQRAAIARMIHERSVGLFHSVGAGKTAEMIIGISELKRLGLIHKAAMVVPNHMLNQFAGDWLQLYPQAKILAASSDDLNVENRRRFIAKIATNDWDAVIMTRTAFQRIQLSPENEQAFEERQIATAREQITRLKAGENGSGAALRRIEKQLASREEKLRAQRDVARDDGLNWEQTGFDYLGVDELHDFKNLQTVSAVRDVNIDGSKRAMDLFAKIDYHRNTLGQDRVMVGATATPIANSIAEMYVMQRYIDPAALERVGIDDMDSWIATFAEVVTAPELSVAGGERLVWKNRVAKFNNVPELLAMFHAFGDVKTPEDLKLPVPAIAPRPEDGERLPHTLIVPASDALTGYTKDLGERADRVSSGGVDPSVDNMLKIGTDGRLAALDVRLVGLPNDDLQPSKVSTAAKLLHRVWEQTRDYTYLDPTGQPSPVKGALQVVFCDLSTPGSGFHVYGALKDALVQRGMPPEKIRFIHEAHNDNEKAQLLESCRNGHVAVLIGSTPKMGTGVNIQPRVIHLMHLDAPWRPADLTQRDGRGIRQLNQNPEVMVTNVVTDRSFDGFLWSTLERKARFIDQVMTGRGVERSVEDIGQAALNYAEIKASIAGNPLLLEHAEAERDLARLTRLARAHERSNWSLRATIKTGEEKLAQIADELPKLQAAAAKTVDTRGDAFRMEVFVPAAGRMAAGERDTKGVPVSDRTAAVAQLQRALSFVGQPTKIAHLGGHDIYAHRQVGMKYGYYSFKFTMPDAPGVVAFSDDIGINERAADRGTVTRLENLTTAIPKRITELQLKQPDYERSVSQAKEIEGKPFPKAEELTAAQQRYADVSKALADSRNQAAATEPDETGPAAAVVTGPVLTAPVPPREFAVPGPPHPHLQQNLQNATRLQEMAPGIASVQLGGVRR